MSSNSLAQQSGTGSSSSVTGNTPRTTNNPPVAVKRTSLAQRVVGAVDAVAQGALQAGLTIADRHFLTDEQRETTTRRAIGEIASNPLKLFSKLSEFLKDEIKVEE